MRFCLTCRRQTPPPPASAPWPPPAAAGWQQATPSWPRPPSCPPPPSPPPPKWTRQGMLEAWQTHLTLHEKLSLLGELLPEDSPSTKAAFSLQLKMKMHFFIFFHPQYLHSRIQLCHNCYQKKNESQGQLQSTRNISFSLIPHLIHLGPEPLLLLLPLEKMPVLEPLSPPHHLCQHTCDRVNQPARTSLDFL